MDADEKSTDYLLLSNEEDKDDPPSPTPRRRGTWLLPLVCLLCGLLPSFLVWLAMSQSSRGRGGIERLYQTPIPDSPTEMRTFEWNYTFAGLRTLESERAWRSLLPFGRGYVLIEEPSTYNLPSNEGEHTRDGTIFSVALYHQLHCLSVIRRDYFDLVEGVLNNYTGNEMKTLVQKQIKMFHNRHCLDYIRQTLVCQADMTLEWKRTEPDGSKIQVDGMGIPHECKSEKSIHDYMQGQRRQVKEARRNL